MCPYGTHYYYRGIDDGTPCDPELCPRAIFRITESGREYYCADAWNVLVLDSIEKRLAEISAHLSGAKPDEDDSLGIWCIPPYPADEDE